MIAYLMKSKGWRLVHSYQWVKERRPSVELAQGMFVYCFHFCFQSPVKPSDCSVGQLKALIWPSYLFEDHYGNFIKLKGKHLHFQSVHLFDHLFAIVFPLLSPLFSGDPLMPVCWLGFNKTLSLCPCLS